MRKSVAAGQIHLCNEGQNLQIETFYVMFYFQL